MLFRSLQIVTNRDLIAIDGDALAKPAKRVKHGAADVLARPLENVDIALCFFNKAGSAQNVSYDLTKLRLDPYFNLSDETAYHATELWSGEEREGATLTMRVPRHGVKVFRVSAQ